MSDSVSLLAEISPVPAWQLDANGRLIWCNTAYASLFALSPDQAVATQKKVPLAGSSRLHIITEGKRRLYAVTATALPDGQGLLGTAQDISVEEDLAAENKRTQGATKELLEQLSTAVATFGADQRLEFFNTAFVQLWGVEDSFLNTRPKLGEIMEKLREMRRLPEQADFRRYKQSWLDMFTNLIDPAEDMMHLPDGSALRMLTVPNPAGGLIFTFEDVTSRLELETSYNTLVAVQRETLDNLTEGIAVFGGDGRLKLWNPAFVRLWGLNPEDMTGDPHITRLVARMENVFSAPDWSDARDILLAQVLNGEEVSGRLTLRDSRLVAYSAVLLPDGGVLLSHADVTDSAQVEKALREKNSALEAAERLKLDFLANVSYQLRTPLNAIMGFTEILANQYFGPLNAKQLQYTEGTREASERLLSLIDDILDLSTIEAGYLKLDYEDVDVQGLLLSLQTLTAPWAQKEGMDIRLGLAIDPGHIQADPRRLKQILLNLIRNAMAYSPVGQEITLSAHRHDDEMEVWVEDHGVGIDDNDQSRILEPFEKGRQMERDGKKQQGGAGLGLTLVRDITELHGGRLLIEKTAGGGTTVRLFLPLNQPVPMGNP